MKSNSTPLVSVCIPCYKHVDLFKRCVQSIISQSYNNFELIITDDSPNNEIEELVKLSYKNDSRVIYVKNPTALGSPGNWNAGLKLAKGDYIKIMHHDDWFATTDALQRFVDTALKTGADFICSGCFNVGPGGAKKHSIPKQFRKNWSAHPKYIFFANYVGNPSTIFYKRPSGDNILYDIRTLWYVDVLFYYEYLKVMPKIAYIDDFLLNTAAGMETQVTNSLVDAKVALKEFIYVCKKHKLSEEHGFLTRLTMLEIMKRYRISSKKELETLLGEPFNLSLPYTLLKLPINRQFFNVLKHLLIRSY